MRFAKALEFIALRKLDFIVVDSDFTSKQLVDKDCFGERMTYVPLNKISFHDCNIDVQNICFLIGCK